MAIFGMRTGEPRRAGVSGSERDRPGLRRAVLLTVVTLVAGLMLSVTATLATEASAADAMPAPARGCKDTPDGPRILAAYSIKDGELTHRKGTDCVAARQIWARFAELIPAERRTMLTRFELLTRREQGAEVFQNRNLRTWTLAVSQGLEPDLDYILIHEYAHLLTLGPEQVPPVTDANLARVSVTCPTYFTGEGCSKGGSLINQYVNWYWPVRHRQISNRDQNSDDIPRLARLFPRRFVTAYAATNPGEDIAESFAVFVTRHRRPAPTIIATRKVNFFWNRPAMRRLRSQIRANL